MLTDSDEARDSRYRVPALAKGLDILEFLAGQPAGLTMTSLAARLNRTIPELYRIVQLLETRGYVTRDPDTNHYSLSMKLFRLAHAHPPLRSLVSFAMPILETLAEAIGHSCHMSILDDLDALIVAQVDSSLPQRYSVRLGARIPIWESNSGVLLVASMDEITRNTMISKLETMLSPARLADFLRKERMARKQGVVKDKSYLTPAVITVSRPVRNNHGAVVAVMTVPMLQHRRRETSVEEVDAKLAQATADLSRALGFGGE